MPWVSRISCRFCGKTLPIVNDDRLNHCPACGQQDPNPDYTFYKSMVECFDKVCQRSKPYEE